MFFWNVRLLWLLTLSRYFCPGRKFKFSMGGTFFVADGINSVGDYNSSPGGCRLCVCLSVCVSPLFFTFRNGITSKRFELLS